MPAVNRGSIGCCPRGVPVNRPIKGNVHMTETKNNDNFENPTGQKSKSITAFDLEMPEATQPEHRVYEEISTAATDINIAFEAAKRDMKEDSGVFLQKPDGACLDFANQNGKVIVTKCFGGKPTAIRPRTPDRSLPPENRRDEMTDSEGIGAASGDRDSRQKQMRGA